MHSHLNLYRPLQAICMLRLAVIFVRFICFGGLRLAPRVLAHDAAAGRYAGYPRVVATVLTLAPRGMATIQTSDGTRSAVVRGTGG